MKMRQDKIIDAVPMLFYTLLFVAGQLENARRITAISWPTTGKKINKDNAGFKPAFRKIFQVG